LKNIRTQGRRKKGERKKGKGEASGLLVGWGVGGGWGFGGGGGGVVGGGGVFVVGAFREGTGEGQTGTTLGHNLNWT